MGWRDADGMPRYVVLLAHGYGEHIGRYEHVAAALVADGAAVYGLDHIGHGRSDGERVLIDDYDDVLADLSVVHGRAVAEHPALPVSADRPLDGRHDRRPATPSCTATS